MLRIKNAAHFALPAAIEEAVENLCQKKALYAVRTPNFLVPLDTGNGRSRIIRTIADRLYDANAQNFSSRDRFLDFTLKGTALSVYEADVSIQESAEFANHYNGIIGLSIDAMIPHLTDSVGEKFFNLVNQIREHSMLIIFVPVNCNPKSMELFLDKIGASLKILPPISYSTGDYARMFYDFLPREIDSKNMKQPISRAKFDGFEAHKKSIEAYIEKNIRNMRTCLHKVKTA